MADAFDDASLEKFHSYEDYIDAQVTPQDHQYLMDPNLARMLVECGCKKGEVLSEEQFNAMKESLEGSKRAKLQTGPKKLAGSQSAMTDKPFLIELSKREELVQKGKLSVIIFIRDYNSQGQEISGYIDFGHRLQTENFEDYFRETKRLLPRPSDLSFFNWDTYHVTSNESPNYTIIPDSEMGLLFKNKRDRKVMDCNPKADCPGDNSKRIEIDTGEYVQVVIFDHCTRKKS